MSLGTRMGFALMPIGAQLIIQVSDWRMAALALAATVAVFGILPSLRWLHARPEALGLLPDGETAATRHSPNRRPYRDEYSWSRQDALRTRAFWLVTFAVSLMSLTGGAVNLHQIPHLVDRGLSPETAALVIGLVGSAAGVTILILVHSLTMALLYAAVNGLFFGMLVASNQIVFADYFGRDAIGAIRGYSQPFQLGTNAFGPILAGAAHDLTGSYVAAFIPFTLAYLISALALVIAKKPAPPEAAQAAPPAGM